MRKKGGEGLDREELEGEGKGRRRVGGVEALERASK